MKKLIVFLTVMILVLTTGVTAYADDDALGGNDIREVMTDELITGVLSNVNSHLDTSDLDGRLTIDPKFEDVQVEFEKVTEKDIDFDGAVKQTAHNGKTSINELKESEPEKYVCYYLPVSVHEKNSGEAFTAIVLVGQYLEISEEDKELMRAAGASEEGLEELDNQAGEWYTGFHQLVSGDHNYRETLLSYINDNHLDVDSVIISDRIESGNELLAFCYDENSTEPTIIGVNSLANDDAYISYSLEAKDYFYYD